MAKYKGKYVKAAPKQPRVFLWIGIGCSIAALVFAFFVGKFIWGAVKAGNDRAQAIANYVTPAQPSTEPSTQPQEDAAAPTGEAPAEPSETTGETTLPTEPPRFPVIDFEGLRGESEDVVAWLQVPALEIINYPVVQGEDNAHFSEHAWTGEESENGAIYLDFRNESDFSQVHNILYGHCMKDGTMFQTLGKWEGPTFFENNDRTVLLFLPGETRVYEIFAVERVNGMDVRAYKTDYEGDALWLEALEETVFKSQLHSDAQLTEESQVLTLSTCVGGLTRLAIHAVCVEQVPV